jgi:hypothetical protein
LVPLWLQATVFPAPMTTKLSATLHVPPYDETYDATELLIAMYLFDPPRVRQILWCMLKSPIGPSKLLGDPTADSKTMMYPSIRSNSLLWISQFSPSR